MPREGAERITEMTNQLPPVHLDAEFHAECWKCCGNGSVSWGIDVSGYAHGRYVPKVCFDCNGVGYSVHTMRKEIANAKARARSAAKREAKWAAGQAERDAKAAAKAAAAAEWAAEHPAVVAAVKDLPGEYGDRVRAELAEWGHLSDRTCEQVLAQAAAQPVPAGAQQVVGEVLSTKVQAGYYGKSVLKMLVRDDRGFKVWGTKPAALGRTRPGARVSFTASLEPSGDDPAFGYFSRPKAAVLLSEGAA